MRIQVGWIGSVLLLCTIALCRADISPTEFIGSAVVPKEGTPVQMLNADVEIVWGTPCTMTATFVMLNPTSTDQRVSVGFPMPGDKFVQHAGPDPLTITFDSVPAEITPPGETDEDRDQHRYWFWHRCDHAFHPGKTQVVVKSVIRASLVYATARQEALHYCVESGGKWAENIGEETVTIRFPNQVTTEQIISASPAGYVIRGNSVQWRFSHFKPRGNEYDINFTYIHPEALRVISELRAKLRADPKSVSTQLALAKCLAALGNAKSNSGFPPWRLSKTEFDKIRKAMASDADRKILTTHYQWKGDEVGYEETNSEWSSRRLSLIKALANASYRDAASRSWYILEAERLFKSTLAAEPHNAVAWNTYLANYWRFSFAAIGHWFGQTALGREQKHLIETAAQNCPQDPCIARWLALTRSKPTNAELEALQDAILSAGFRDADLPKLQYDYY
jgi:hypothetical protein